MVVVKTGEYKHTEFEHHMAFLKAHCPHIQLNNLSANSQLSC